MFSNTTSSFFFRRVVRCLGFFIASSLAVLSVDREAQAQSQASASTPKEKSNVPAPPVRPKTPDAKAQSTPPLDSHRLEWGVLPAIAFDTDVGFGFGVVGTLARFHPNYNPYRWRIEALIYMTLKVDAGEVSLPYHDDYITLDMPGLAGGKLRINAQLGFGRYTTAGYYGFGNASVLDPRWTKFDPETQKAEYQRARQYHWFDRIYPSAQLNARLNLYEGKQQKLQLFFGGAFLYNVIGVYEGSKLERDIIASKTDPVLREFLLGVSNHPLLTFQTGVIWDSRNHEYAPYNGMFHEISVRGSPGIANSLYYVGLNATARFYYSLWKEYLVIAARLVGDMLFGNVPFYELSRYGGLFPKDGPGGGTSVRGVPLQRYSGKAKVIGNFELRAKLIPFSIAGERFNIGLLGFFDAGRVWSDTQARAALDGTDVGMKYGFGGGLRIQWGETFIIRADVAYSPVDDNVGVYIDINHIF